MFRSVFAKYLAAFMLILSFSFAILAASIGSLMLNYSDESRENNLTASADSLRIYLEEQFNGTTAQGFRDYVKRYQTVIDRDIALLIDYAGSVSLLVTDASGTIIASEHGAVDFQIPQEYLSEAASAPFVKELDLGGFFDRACLVRGIPVRGGSTVIGYVFACSTETGVGNLVMVMMKTLMMTMLWVLIAALIAIYFISEKITLPLRDMSRAAKSFAQGNFDVRVPVSGRDEVAELTVAFNNMAQSMQNLETMRSSFIANISHELRTPMTTIGGFIDSILAGAIPPDKHEYYLKVISDEVKRLSRLVTSLLDISRIQAGERKFNKQPFDVCEMARQILISFEQKIEEKKLDVLFDCEEDKLFVYADRDAIYQIFYNICHNAVKFSREGGKYRVRLVGKEKKVFVSVFNEGIGIREEDLPFVFERFYKVDKSRGLDKSGLGLGMYIAKTVIDAHGEEIWVKSTWGENCEFFFTLTRTHEQPPRKNREELPEGGMHEDRSQ